MVLFLIEERPRGDHQLNGASRVRGQNGIISSGRGSDARFLAITGEVS